MGAGGLQKGGRTKKGEKRGERKRKNVCGKLDKRSGKPSDWSIVTGFVNTQALLTQMRNAIWRRSEALGYARTTGVINSILYWLISATSKRPCYGSLWAVYKWPRPPFVKFAHRRSFDFSRRASPLFCRSTFLALHRNYKLNNWKRLG